MKLALAALAGLSLTAVAAPAVRTEAYNPLDTFRDLAACRKERPVIRPIVPTTVTAPDPKELRKIQACPGIAVAPNGRLWVAYIAGSAPDENRSNTHVLATSADGGKTWKDVLVADPDGPGPRRISDGNVWIAPNGRLWWYWNDRLCVDRHPCAHAGDATSEQLWLLELDAEREPDPANLPVPRLVSHGLMLNKPTVLASGAIALPVAHWSRFEAGGFVLTEDGGKTFEERGGARNPASGASCTEHHIVEKRNGDLVQWMRCQKGIAEAVSHDGGRTWSRAVEVPGLKHTVSRFAFRKLRSGRWLLVKHGRLDEDCGRTNLRAYLSDDEGRTWKGGLLLGRGTYPDVSEAADGRIYAVVDRTRVNTHRSCLCWFAFTEDEILAGGEATPHEFLVRDLMAFERPVRWDLAKVEPQSALAADVKAPGADKTNTIAFVSEHTLTVVRGAGRTIIGRLVAQEQPVLFEVSGEAGGLIWSRYVQPGQPRSLAVDLSTNRLYTLRAVGGPGAWCDLRFDYDPKMKETDNDSWNGEPLATWSSARLAAAAPRVTCPLEWKTGANMKIEDGQLVVDVRPDTPAARAANWATARIDTALFRDRSVRVEARVRGENVCGPVKIMTIWKDDLTGVTLYPEPYYPGGVRPSGTFGWTNLSYVVTWRGTDVSDASLNLGLQNASGRVVFDLASVKVTECEDVYTQTNADLVCEYDDLVLKRPALRGVMSPSPLKVTEDDIRTLAAWGAKLLRYQMLAGRRDFQRRHPDFRIPERTSSHEEWQRYDRLWMDAVVDHLVDNVIPWARKYGLMVVVDLHQVPGGAFKAFGAQGVFYRPEFAEDYFEAWRRIATRVKGNEDVVYGYDLMNEPWQKPVPCAWDYWRLQERAAREIRRIDPVTPLVFNANEASEPDAWRYFAPIDLKNVIYQVHFYRDNTYTHGRWNSPEKAMVYPNPKTGFTKENLRRRLAYVRRFEQRHKARVYCGEFSACGWAPGADLWIADMIDIFEDYGWDWTFHAFREADMWSVERVYDGCFHGAKPHPSEDNPRMRALKAGFRRGQVK